MGRRPTIVRKHYAGASDSDSPNRLSRRLDQQEHSRRNPPLRKEATASLPCGLLISFMTIPLEMSRLPLFSDSRLTEEALGNEARRSNVGAIKNWGLLKGDP